MPLSPDTYTLFNQDSRNRFIEPGTESIKPVSDVALIACRKALNSDNAFVSIDKFREYFELALTNPALSQLTESEVKELEALHKRLNYKDGSELRRLKKLVYGTRLQSVKLVNEFELI